eukprot:scaffold82481_cov63-Phaeocystis_antarctica.AAC.4
MPPPHTRASPAAPSRSAACTAPLSAFEGLAGGASLPPYRPSRTHRRLLLCVRLLRTTWYLARRQTDGALASLRPCGAVGERHAARHVGELCAWGIRCPEVLQAQYEGSEVTNVQNVVVAYHPKTRGVLESDLESAAS